MTTVIKVENLSKRYRLGQIGGGTLSEDLNRWWARVRRKPDPTLKIGQEDHRNIEGETIWALRDVSFEVQQGEVLGIIGRNGAGKSTLLKIISRITAPTSGQIKVKGRVGSLLEVGTGFHPELTGRENIYLNGTILGMKRAEIDRKFVEIVDFSEVEKFIDTPVKRYSSGMYVRLAFAVAAHLEPEIMLVDEVLAVGDAAFQKKCLGKMGDVAKEGRTVLFVSHNMAAIENLCQRTIWVDEGKITKDGFSHQVVSEYLYMFLSEKATVDLENFTSRTGSGQARVVQVEFLDANGQLCSSVRMGDSVTIRLKVRSNDGQKRISLGTHIHTEDGIFVADFRTDHMGFDPGIITEESKCFDLVIDPILLIPRTYIISPWVADSYGKEDFDWVKYAAKFTVEASDFLGTGAMLTSKYGIVHIPSHWKQVEHKRIAMN